MTLIRRGDSAAQRAGSACLAQPFDIFPPRVVVLGVNALCAAGKSFAAGDDIAPRILAGERFLIAGPTAFQCEQFARDLRAKLDARRPGSGVHVTVVNGETVRTAANDEDKEVTVAQRLAMEIAALDASELFLPFRDDKGRRIARKNRARIGRAIIVTHACLGLLPISATPDAWHLLIDEAMAALTAHEVKLPNAVLAGLRFVPQEDGSPRMRAGTADLEAALAKVELRRRSLAQDARFARTRGDAAEADRLFAEAKKLRDGVENHLREMARKLASGNWTIHAPSRALEDAGHGRLGLRLSEGGETEMVFTHLLNWDAMLGVARHRWASVTIMAANLPETFCAMTLARQGYAIADHPTIPARLRYIDRHPNGRRLRLYYLTSGSASKTLRDLDVLDEDGETKKLAEFWRTDIEKLFAGHPFAWAGNKDLPDGFLTGERMPYVSHGLNHFQKHSRIAVLSISNMRPAQLAAVMEHGFTRAEVRTAIMNELVYQTGCRGDFRNPDAEGDYIVVVPDAGCAAYFAERALDCSDPLPLGSPEPPQKTLGRPKQHEDQADRKRANKAAQRGRDRERIAAALANFREDCLDLTEPHTDWPVHLYRDIEAARSFREMSFGGFDDMEAWLRRESERVIADKADNYLILAGEVPQHEGGDIPMDWPRNAEGKPTFRAKGNVVRRTDLWFDIEMLKHKGSGENSGPPIPWPQFKNLFAGTRMIGHSSYSHDDSDPALARYRVVMALDRACSVLTYEAIYKMVVQRVAEAGWLVWRRGAPKASTKVRYSGIDTSKVPATSIFYAPVKAAGREQHAWFESVDGEPIDVAAWLADDAMLKRVLPDEYLPEAEAPVLPAYAATRFDLMAREARLARAIAEYVLIGRGGQHDGLFRLGWRLAGYACSLAEIDGHLHDAANQSADKADRKKDVKDILTDIRRRKLGIT